MPDIAVSTRQAIRTRIGRNVGAISFSGTAGSVTTTTVVSTDLQATRASALVGDALIITSGASSGNILPITAYTYATGQGTATFPALAGLTGTPTFEIWANNVAKPLEVNAFIDEAIRSVWGVHLLDLQEDAFRFADVLNGAGEFEFWETTAIPESVDGAINWVNTTATMLQETTIVGFKSVFSARGQSLRLTNDASSAGTATFTQPEFWNYRKHSMKLIGLVRAPAGSRARLQFDDGVTTYSTPYASINDQFNELTVSGAIGDNPTRLRVTCDIATGTSINCYFDDVRLLDSNYQTLMLPTTFTHVHTILPEREAYSGTYLSRTVPLALWRPMRDQSAIIFDPAVPAAYYDRRMLILGHGFADIPTADSSTVALNASYVEAAATARLLASKIATAPNPQALASSLNYWNGEAERLRFRLQVSPDPGAKRLFVR